MLLQGRKSSALRVEQAEETSAVEREENPCFAAEQKTEVEESCHSEAKSGSPERTIDDVDSDNLRDATPRTLVYFRTITADPEKLWKKLTEWFEDVASQLGLSVRVIDCTALRGLAADLQQSDCRKPDESVVA